MLTIVIEERSGFDRDREPLTLGVPFPRGVLFHDSHLRLNDPYGPSLPAQTRVLDRWSDQSCRWVLLDFQASVLANQRISYSLAWNSEAPRTLVTPEVQVEQFPGVISVDTGATRFWLDKDIFRPFSRVSVGGSEVVAEGTSGVTLEDSTGQTWEPGIEQVSVETVGPLRSTLLFEGSFRRADAQSIARFFSRVHFYAGHSQVKIEFTIRNPRPAKHADGLWDLGDPGSIYFKDLSIQAELRGNTPTAIHWVEDPSVKPTTSHGGYVEIYQDSSGGKNWNSRNHVNRSGEIRNKFRGYRIRAAEFSTTGTRAQPVAVLSNSEHFIAASVENFWQNFPKALEVSESHLTVRLFQKQYEDVFELQGGEQKTHSMYFHFGSSFESANPLRWIHDPLKPRLEPEWYAECQVFRFLVPESKDPNKEYLDLVHGAVDGEAGFFKKRDCMLF